MSTYRVKSACLISLWKTKNIWWSVVHLSKLRALIENAMSVSFLFFWIFHTCREYIFANQMSHFCSHLFFLMISSHPIIFFVCHWFIVFCDPLSFYLQLLTGEWMWICPLAYEQIVRDYTTEDNHFPSHQYSPSASDFLRES